jgi:hypothetical protein
MEWRETYPRFAQSSSPLFIVRERGLDQGKWPESQDEVEHALIDILPPYFICRQKWNISPVIMTKIYILFFLFLWLKQIMVPNIEF